MFNSPIRVDDLDLGDLPLRWRRLDALFSRAVYVRDTRAPNILDERMVDESSPGGHRLYPTVERYLTAAHDCHTALPALLREHGATQCAMWSLLRAQFEAGFFALWLIDPEDSHERVIRGIRREWLDDMQSRRYYREILQDPEFPIDAVDRGRRRQEQKDSDRDHDRVYTGEAQTLGASWTNPADVSVVNELGKLRTNAIPGGGVLLRHVWRSLAGLQHGDVGALLRVSEQTVEGPSPGGQILRLSPSDTAFRTIASTTAVLTSSALLRYIECHGPARQPSAADPSHPALFHRD